MEPIRFKVNIDPIELKAKPKEFDGRLRNRLCNSKTIRETTLNEFAEQITSGHTFTQAAMTGTTGDTWQTQQLICADIDNAKDLRDEDGNFVTDENGKRISVIIDNPLWPAEACEIVQQHFGRRPALVYYSFSNKTEWPKFRICMLLAEPMTDRDKAGDYNKRFAALFNAARPGCADTSAKDSARLFYGTTSDGLFFSYDESDPDSCVTAEQFEQLPPVEEEKKQPERVELPTMKREERKASSSAATKYEKLQEQFEYDVDNCDLLAYIDQTEPGQPVKKGRNYYFNPCPLCGHDNDFQVTGALFHAWGAGDSLPGGKQKAGRVIEYLMYRHNLEYGAACDKFKYEIMGYDRDEWIRAWKEKKELERKTTAAQDFENEPLEYEYPFNEDLSVSDENDATNGNNGRYEPAGVLTYDRALEIFKTADDKYIEMRNFQEICKTAKIKPHDSIVIAADTGAGKSSLAINFIDDLNSDYPVMYFNLEMDELTILRRLVSIRTGLELDRIEGYKHDERTAAAVNSALRVITSRKPLQIIQDKYHIKDIEKEIIQATAERDEPTIVVIDHSLLVTTKESYSRYERFTQISEDLRRISRLNNVIMFVLLQQNRDGKSDDKKRPSNSSLKESGSWENDATHIMFLWYNQQTKRKMLLLTKNRSGATGDFNLEYNSTTQIYKEAKHQPDNAANAAPVVKANKRDQERAQLQEWYAEAYAATGGNVTLHDMAEIGGVTTAVVKRRLKEYGGYTVEGEQYDPAGIDTNIEQAQFIRLTMAEAPAFDDPKPATPQKRY